jgi:hypothetical protein
MKQKKHHKLATVPQSLMMTATAAAAVMPQPSAAASAANLDLAQAEKQCERLRRSIQNAQAVVRTRSVLADYYERNRLEEAEKVLQSAEIRALIQQETLSIEIAQEALDVLTESLAAEKKRRGVA